MSPKWPRCWSRTPTVRLLAQLRELERGLGLLPLEQREAILLVGLEGMCLRRSGRGSGVPIGTVRSRLSRGREALRKLMDMDMDMAA